jgi:hypothetical protein
VGTVSAVNIGQMFRNGFTGDVKSVDAMPLLVNGSDARTAEADGAEITKMPLAPMKKTPRTRTLEEAWEYYHTPRAQYPTAPGWATARSLNQIIPHDAYNMAEVFLTQPLQIVAGSEAGRKWMNDDLLKRVASKDNKMHVVQGSNRMKLYGVAQICRRSGFSSRIILREDTRARKNDKGQGRLSSSFIDSSSPNSAEACH